MNKQIKKIIIIYYSCLVCVLLYSAAMIFELNDRTLQMIFFNVGQGDSILIRLPDRRRILIDGGPDNAVLYRLGRYLPYFDRQLELVILSHPDADHLNGLIEVVRRYRVKAIVLSGSISAEPAFGELENLIKKNNIKLIMAKETSEINISADSIIKIFNPKSDSACASLNDCSVVAKFQYKNISLLLTGDITAAVERELISKGTDLKSTILKVSHHGSRFSTSAEFLDKVKPQLAVISVGINRFNHPSPETVDNLSRQLIPALTTLAAGDILILSDGERFWRGP